jgi:hypothetical protein
MTLTRRDFIKLFGVTLASLLASRCQAVLPAAQTPRDRLRRLWFSFSELAEKTRAGRNDEDELGQKMSADHRAELDALVAAGGLSAPAADLVQEAYSAAVYHVWRSNAPITCYVPTFVDYGPSSAAVLVKQAEILGELRGKGMIDASTLSRAQSALEHDLAFYQLTDDETRALYQGLIEQNQDGGKPIPSFDALELDLAPDAREAARFILDLLSTQ